MGKYNNLARAAKKLAQVDQRIAMEKWRKLLAENIVDKPGFWDAYLANPPLPKNFTVSGKLPEIRFPEDDLYRVGTPPPIPCISRPSRCSFAPPPVPLPRSRVGETCMRPYGPAPCYAAPCAFSQGQCVCVVCRFTRRETRTGRMR